MPKCRRLKTVGFPSNRVEHGKKITILANLPVRYPRHRNERPTLGSPNDSLDLDLHLPFASPIREWMSVRDTGFILDNNTPDHHQVVATVFKLIGRFVRAKASATSDKTHQGYPKPIDHAASS